MKKILLTLLATGFMIAAGNTQVISQWTFENYTAPGAVAANTALPGIAADTGSGTATALHTTASTYSTPVGNGTAKSLSSNGWSIGDYYQFQLSTVGLVGINQGVGVSFSQTGSNTGPRDFSLQYSLDGTAFTNFTSYSITNVTWNATTTLSGNQFSFDLSSIAILNSASTLYFRLADAATTAVTGGTVASTGTGRVDTFTVSAIPEPSTYAMIVGAAGLLFVVSRRKSRMTD